MTITCPRVDRKMSEQLVTITHKVYKILILKSVVTEIKASEEFECKSFQQSIWCVSICADFVPTKIIDQMLNITS
jgi:hypothetical protein